MPRDDCRSPTILSYNMNTRQSPDGDRRRGQIASWATGIRPGLLWWPLWLLVIAALANTGWRLLGHTPYRIDVDIYRLGAQAWLQGRPLYGGATFHTPIGLSLPFTYPPLAAVLFCPFAWLQMPGASIAITMVTLALLTVSMALLLTRLDVWAMSRLLPGPAWLRRCWLAMAVTSAALWLEPISSNLAFGQINVVLMTLVIADCVPRQTPWPRGLLLGLAIALKLTPAVFLLYFLLRRDLRTVLTAAASFAAATLAGFALTWRDSWEYWTHTIGNTDRIGAASLNTNQNIAGLLARVGIAERERSLLWIVACFGVLALTVWAMRRVLRANEPTLAVICVALFGLVVSPISWSHHWVWMLPAVLVIGVLGWRRHSPTLGAVSASGLALMVWTPIDLLPKHHEAAAVWWRQLAGASYVWWALAAILAAGITVTVPRTPAQDSHCTDEPYTAPDGVALAAVGGDGQTLS